MPYSEMESENVPNRYSFNGSAYSMKTVWAGDEDGKLKSKITLDLIDELW